MKPNACLGSARVYDSMSQTVNRKGGKYLLQGYHVASAVNQQYDITGTVVRGVTATAVAARQFNDEYKVIKTTKDA